MNPALANDWLEEHLPRLHEDKRLALAPSLAALLEQARAAGVAEGREQVMGVATRLAAQGIDVMTKGRRCA